MSERRLDFLEVLVRDNLGDNLEPDELNQEIVKMKAMFGDMVDEVMSEKMKVLNSYTVKKLMDQKIPVLTKELQKASQNPRKITSYSRNVLSLFDEAPNPD